MSVAAVQRDASGVRLRRELVAASLLAFLLACLHENPAGPASQLASLEMVSDAKLLRVSEQSSSPNVVYVSRSATAEQLGTAVRIETPRGASITTGVRSTGFGPIAIAAEEGDTITLTFFGNFEPRTIREAVPRSSRPRVVRTVPPRGKTDVPLNARLIVVFSEPVDPASVVGRVRLLVGTTAIAGVARVADPSYTMVEFVPNEPLAAVTGYELVVDAGIRDGAGEALDADVRVSFATGQNLVGPPAELDLVPDSLVTIPVGGALQVLASVLDAGGNVLYGQPIEWSVEDALGAGGLAISPTGLITTTSDGFYVITATSGSLTRRLWVTVTPNAAVSVSLEPSSAAVPAGDTLALTATVRDAAGRRINRPGLSWAATPATVASILGTEDPSGVRVVGVTQGSVTVSATSGAATAAAQISVTSPVPVASVAIAPDTVKVLVAGSARAAATVRDATGRVIGRTVAWASQDDAIATVDVTGRITGVSLGETTISATSEGVTSSIPVKVVPLNLVAVVAGYGYFPWGGAHSCAVTDAGDIYCWGKNSSGQTGIGTSGDDVRVPTLVDAPDVRFAAVDAGNVHTCALTAAGGIFCWGNGDYGQLPTTSAECYDYEGNASCSIRPVGLPAEKPLASITTGGWHSCGLTADGEAYCWGWNYHGQLGNGTTTWDFAAALHRVEGGLTFTALSAGRAHTCGLTTAGRAYCWGEMVAAESTTDLVTRPVEVETDLTFTAISSGSGQSCGLTAAGAAHCWVTGGAPSPVAGEFVFSKISVGVDYVCGVTPSGGGMCWGWNEFGNLGDGSYSERETPVPVSGDLTFTSIRAGASHTCGLTAAKVAYCWGANFSRQLGSESAQDSPVPVRVAAQP